MCSTKMVLLLDQRQFRAQSSCQDLVVASRSNRTDRRARFGIYFLVVDARALANALAARLVVEPLHRVTGTRQHVEQAFGIADAVLVVVFAPQGRKHAWHRYFGGGAARGHVAECGHVGLRELRVGRARVAPAVKSWRRARSRPPPAPTPAAASAAATATSGAHRCPWLHAARAHRRRGAPQFTARP